MIMALALFDASFVCIDTSVENHFLNSHLNVFVNLNSQDLSQS